jgi:hypothetical protein
MRQRGTRQVDEDGPAFYSAWISVCAALDTFISMKARNFEMIILENVDLHSHPTDLMSEEAADDGD